jgi:hypothetical protein
MSPMNSTEHSSVNWSTALPTAAREVEDFLSAAGWDQPPQLFALVPTSQLLQAEPGLAGRLAVADGLTPVAQDPLSDADVAEKLAEICWPDGVTGCALAQEIVVLPPEAEAELDRAVAGATGSEDDLDRVAVRVAQHHPDRRDARLVVAVLREGGHCCLLRVRGTGDQPDELVEHPDLAPNMVSALLRTLDVG